MVGPVVGEVGGLTLEQLQSRLAFQIAHTRSPGATWGIEVVSVASGKTLFSTNANRLFIPASNTKLFTAALALDGLGSTQRVSTRLLAAGLPDADGRLKGGLWIRGEGDRTLSGRFQGGGWKGGIEPVVAAIRTAGVKRIEGDLIAFGAVFRGPPYGKGWNWDDLSGSDAPAVSALTFNNNCFRITLVPGAQSGQPAILRADPPWIVQSTPAGDPPLVSLVNHATTAMTNRETILQLDRPPGSHRVEVTGSIAADDGPETFDITVPSPPAYFLRAVREGLAAAGIEVAGRLRVPGEESESPGAEDGSGLIRPALQELAVVPSPPVSVRVREMMKSSDNLHAQLLLLCVGSRTRASKEGLPTETTDAAGLRAMDQFLARVGLRRTEYYFEEGSGLSRKNVITPHAVVQLLIEMNHHRAAKEWKESLPVGGVDGTLKSRFTGPPTNGNVRAKTGSLSHVAALSGYLTTVTGEPLAFSILVNQYIPDGQGSARREIDELVELLAEFHPRPE